MPAPTVITAAPKLIKDIYFRIGNSIYSSAVNDCYIPAPDHVQALGGGPEDVFEDVPAGARKLNITFLPDWDSATSLANYLLTNETTKATVIFAPNKNGTSYFEVDVLLKAPQIGGKKNQYGEVTIAMTCLTKPVKGTAPVDE